MKTWHWLLIGGAAVAGFLYWKKQTTALVDPPNLEAARALATTLTTQLGKSIGPSWNGSEWEFVDENNLVVKRGL